MVCFQILDWESHVRTEIRSGVDGQIGPIAPSLHPDSAQKLGQLQFREIPWQGMPHAQRRFGPVDGMPGGSSSPEDRRQLCLNPRRWSRSYQT
jgi:hypothetical protein